MGIRRHSKGSSKGGQFAPSATADTQTDSDGKLKLRQADDEVAKGDRKYLLESSYVCLQCKGRDSNIQSDFDTYSYNQSTGDWSVDCRCLDCGNEFRATFHDKKWDREQDGDYIEVNGAKMTGYITVLYDDEGNIYDINGNLLEPDDYDARWSLFRPYNLHLSNKREPSESPTSRKRYWPLGTWPKHPDMDEDEGDPAQVGFVVKWMREGYDAAVERYAEANLPDDDQAIINWGANDPYFGPVIRGFSDVSNEKLEQADTLYPAVRWHSRNIAEGAQDFPYEDEWERIYNEIKSSRRSNRVALNS